jgi:hypothetical protein
LAETRYLKLKLSADLTADAKSNLLAIDALGAYTDRAEDGTLRLRSAENVLIEPQSSDIGGNGQQGTVSIGTSAHSDITVDAYTLAFKIRSALSLINKATTQAVAGKFLDIKYDSPSATLDRTLSVDLGDANRSLAVDTSGTIAVVDGGVTQNITEISGLTTALSIPQGGTGQTTTTLATKALLEGATSALYSEKPSQILSVNAAGTGLEWKAAGQGQVVTISANSPLAVSGTAADPVISLSAATSSQNGYLTSADWTTFNNKADALPGGGTAGTFLRGDNTWSVINTDNVSELAGATNKFFTDGRAQSAVVVQVLSSIDTTHSPSSSAVITQLGFKENTIAPGTTSQYWRGDKSWQTLNTDSVPEGTAQYFTDTRAKTAAVVNSTAGSETDQAPSVSAMKSYVGGAVSGGTYSTTWNPVSEPSKTITHSLDSTSILVGVYNDAGIQVGIDEIDITGSNTVALSAVVDASLSATWTVVVQK